MLTLLTLIDIPDEECPWGRCDVRLFSRQIYILRSSDCINVTAQEKEVNEDVYDLMIT